MAEITYYNPLDESNPFYEQAGKIGWNLHQGTISEQEADDAIWKLYGFSESEEIAVMNDIERFGVGVSIVIQHHQSRKFGIEKSAFDEIVITELKDNPDLMKMDELDRTMHLEMLVREKIDWAEFLVANS